jgi:hypothetical protein
MNKWKVAFFTCLGALFLATILGVYIIVDQAVSLTYQREGFEGVENDLTVLVKIINGADFSKNEIQKSLAQQNLYELVDFESDTVTLNKVVLIFKNDKLLRVNEQL